MSFHPVVSFQMAFLKIFILCIILTSTVSKKNERREERRIASHPVRQMLLNPTTPLLGPLLRGRSGVPQARSGYGYEEPHDAHDHYAHCPDPFVVVNDICIYGMPCTGSTLVSWDNARSTCQAYGTDYDLIVFDDSDQHRAAVEYLQIIDAGEMCPYWIGGRDTGTDTWFWVNGDPMPTGENFWAISTGAVGPIAGGADFAVLAAGNRYIGQLDTVALPLCRYAPEKPAPKCPYTYQTTLHSHPTSYPQPYHNPSYQTTGPALYPAPTYYPNYPRSTLGQKTHSPAPPNYLREASNSLDSSFPRTTFQVSPHVSQHNPPPFPPQSIHQNPQSQLHSGSPPFSPQIIRQGPQRTHHSPSMHQPPSFSSNQVSHIVQGRTPALPHALNSQTPVGGSLFPFASHLPFGPYGLTTQVGSQGGDMISLSNLFLLQQLLKGFETPRKNNLLGYGDLINLGKLLEDKSNRKTQILDEALTSLTSLRNEIHRSEDKFGRNIPKVDKIQLPSTNSEDSTVIEKSNPAEMLNSAMSKFNNAVKDMDERVTSHGNLEAIGNILEQYKEMESKKPSMKIPPPNFLDPLSSLSAIKNGMSLANKKPLPSLPMPTIPLPPPIPGIPLPKREPVLRSGAPIPPKFFQNEAPNKEDLDKIFEIANLRRTERQKKKT